jgi:amino acid adenylation domain-containing protein
MNAAASFDELLERSNLTGRQFLIYAGQRLHPGLVLYNSVYAIRWPDLDPRRFNDVWQKLIDSADALRVVVEEIDGVPQQRVLAAFRYEVDCVDVRGEADPREAARTWIEARLLRPIVLTERIFDTALIRTGDAEYIWFLHIHHIVVDGAGVQILIRRLTELYWDKVSGPEHLPSFEAYAAASCNLRRGEAYRAAKAYWLEQLQKVPETPHFYGVDAFRNTAQERVILTLDHDTGATVTALARSLATQSMSEHAVAANLFNAVFAAYLARVSGSEHVSIGVTFHNRSSESDRHTVGLYMEVFPIALRLQPEDTLMSLMRQVAACTTQALKHRQYSVGHSARAPAFSGLFNYMRSLNRPAGNIEVRRVHPGHGSNAISVSVEPHDGTFDLWFDVNADVAATSSGSRVAGHLKTLLEAAIRQPEAPLARLPLLPEWELKELRAYCTGPPLPVNATGGCHRLFELTAIRTPDATALTFGHTRLSYSELDREATMLARRLRRLGARRGRRVAICLERSAEMIIAVLAVLKSGAAYVPVDPSYPPARIQTMLADSGPAVILTTRSASGTLPPHAAQTIFMDGEPDRNEPQEELNGADVRPSDIAYVIYTSGSTGKPKGCLVTHENVSNHLAWRNSFFPVGPQDCCLQTASLSFDDSVWEILEPLSSGANLVLTRPRFEYDSDYLVNLMADERITVACFVPSLLRTIVEAPGIERCTFLRRLTTGGEGLSLALQRRVAEKIPTTELYNGYGTTEATIASVYWKCVEVAGQAGVPIGRPIANTEVYVLDRELQIVPPGVPGEIHIGGAGVAQGYLDRPDLTADRFVPDLLGPVSGRRLYRTGDVGRLRSDGVLEFVGRVDDQVKIRGIRVELGDIEAAVLEHPDVRAAAATCSDTPAGKRLVAYFVSTGSREVPAAELRAFVKDRLPAAWVPNRFEPIGALPLTPSGKLDRRSLPQLAIEEPACPVPPRTELEKQLVTLWEGVLQARPIGVRDDFFELGGHSLLAVQLASSVARLVGRTLSPGLLFESPTIETLAAYLTRTPTRATALVLLASGSADTPLFLIHHISGDITAYRDLARHLGAGRTIYGVRAPELDTNEKPLDRIEAMATRYVREIRTVQPKGPYLLGGHSAGAHIAYEMARQLRAGGDEVALLAILEADARRPGGPRGLLDTVRFQVESVRKIPPRQRGTYVLQKIRGRLPSRNPGDSRASPDATTKNAVWLAMERAVRAYQPAEYPGSVTLFRAVDRSVTGTYSRTLGWARLAKGGVRVIDVPGTHSTVLRPGSEPPMAAKLRACLEEMKLR